MKRLCLYFRWRTALKKSDFLGTFQETTEQAGPFSTNVWNKWTMCGQSVDQKNRSTRPQSHTAQPLRPFPGKGTALRNISDPRCLACYGITETICQGCAGIALAALPLTDGSGCANWQSGDGE